MQNKGTYLYVLYTVKNLRNIILRYNHRFLFFSIFLLLFCFLQKNYILKDEITLQIILFITSKSNIETIRFMLSEGEKRNLSKMYKVKFIDLIFF